MSIQKPKWFEDTHLVTLLMCGSSPEYEALTFYAAIEYMQKVMYHFKCSIALDHQLELLDPAAEYWEEYKEWLMQQKYPRAYWPSIRLHWLHAIHPTRGQFYKTFATGD